MKKSLFFIMLCFTSVVNAATVSYSDRTAFEAAAGLLSTETFNSFTTEQSFATTPLDVGDFSLSTTSTYSGDRNTIDLQPTLFPEFNVDGSTIANVLIETGTSFFLTFDNPIFSFGADLASFQDDMLRTNIYAGGQSFTPAIGGDFDVMFFGLVSDVAFDVVEFRADFINDGFGLDNVSYSHVSAVPVPAAAWLFGSALLGFIGISRKKKAA